MMGLFVGHAELFSMTGTHSCFAKMYLQCIQSRAALTVLAMQKVLNKLLMTNLLY